VPARARAARTTVFLITHAAEELAMSTTTVTTTGTTIPVTSTLETVPQTWDDAADRTFFTVVARLFTPEFLYGASVLLASFDTPWSNA
jgi:hypothetical protein